MISCEVIRDLIPLYLDDCCSEQSRCLVEEHVRECVDCRKHLEQMNQELTVEDKDIQEHMEEERLLRESREALKKEVKTDYMTKAVKLDIPLNLLIIALIVGNSIFKCREGVYQNIFGMTASMEVPLLGVAWEAVVLLSICLVFEAAFLRGNKKGNADATAWMMSAASMIFKLGITIALAAARIVTLFIK